MDSTNVWPWGEDDTAEDYESESLVEHAVLDEVYASDSISAQTSLDMSQDAVPLDITDGRSCLSVPNYAVEAVLQLIELGEESWLANAVFETTLDSSSLNIDGPDNDSLNLNGVSEILIPNKLVPRVERLIELLEEAGTPEDGDL